MSINNKKNAQITIPLPQAKSIYIVVVTSLLIFFIADKCNRQDIYVPASKPELYLADKAAIYVTDIERFISKIKSVSKRLNIHPEWLMAVIYNESKFKSNVYNYSGSGAVGLLQFMPATAVDLGTTTQELANMSAVDQLDYVYLYLAKVYKRSNVVKAGIRSLTDLYLAILYPRAIGKDYCFSIYSSPSRQYFSNKGLDFNQDKSVTISDIDNHLKAKYPTAFLLTIDQND
jgi:hypothetical protein